MITSDDIITTDKYYNAFPKQYFKIDIIDKKSPMVLARTNHLSTAKRAAFFDYGSWGCMY